MFGYDNTGLGELQTIGSVAAYQYDRRGLLRTTINPSANTVDSTFWDAAGWLEQRRLVRGMTYLQADTLSYDPTGRVLSSRNVADITTTGYAGLGGIDESVVLKRGAANPSEERVYTDPLGHLSMVRSGCCGTLQARTYTFDPVTGRQTQMRHEFASAAASSEFDPAGNRIRHATREVANKWNGPGQVEVVTVGRSYHDPLGQLRVVDKRTLPDPQTALTSGVPHALIGAYEEYRYDALGRRVLKRSRRENCPAAFCPSHIERYVWDQSALLTEIRYPGDNGLPFDSLERDTGYVFTVANFAPPNDPPIQDTLFSPHYGRVHYVPSPTLDKPAAVVRYRYGNGQRNVKWDEVTAFPHYTWRGLAAGDQKALSADPTTTDIEWAAADARAFGQIPIPGNAPKSWFGSLIIEQRDASGLHYRRARYYDPVTGKFTQEDPIGLAGGLNLYGYANGDPVNFSDPFGLCPDPSDLWCQAFESGFTFLAER